MSEILTDKHIQIEGISVKIKEITADNKDAIVDTGELIDLCYVDKLTRRKVIKFIVDKLNVSQAKYKFITPNGSYYIRVRVQEWVHPDAIYEWAAYNGIDIAKQMFKVEEIESSRDEVKGRFKTLLSKVVRVFDRINGDNPPEITIPERRNEVEEGTEDKEETVIKEISSEEIGQVTTNNSDRKERLKEFFDKFDEVDPDKFFEAIDGERSVDDVYK